MEMTTSSKGIDLLHKTLWADTPLSEVTSIETCPNNGNIALISTANQVSTFDYRTGSIIQSLTIPIGDRVVSASFHPSGKHVLIATQHSIQLANVLFDGLVLFWRTSSPWQFVDAKFNSRGTLFAAISGASIIVYDFINSNEVSSIKCSSSTKALSWGLNCTIFAVSREGQSIYKYDALTGKIATQYNLEEGKVVAHTSANDKLILVTSNSSIIFLNQDMSKVDKTVSVEEEYTLNGALCVSSDGLLFVGMHHRDNVNATVVRIFSSDDRSDYYDQQLDEKVNIMQLSHNDRYLLTNNALYQIHDRRASSNQYITSLDMSSSSLEEDAFDETDEQTEHLVSTNFVESVLDLLNDLESRVTERELMNELQIRSTHNAHTEEITAIKESFNKEILELEKQRAELIQEKRTMLKNQQTSS